MLRWSSDGCVCSHQVLLDFESLGLIFIPSDDYSVLWVSILPSGFTL
jgi:hypothetical protein